MKNGINHSTETHTLILLALSLSLARAPIAIVRVGAKTEAIKIWFSNDNHYFLVCSFSSSFFLLLIYVVRVNVNNVSAETILIDFAQREKCKFIAYNSNDQRTMKRKWQCS